MRDKEHEDYTGSAPYGEGKSLRPVEVVLIRVSMTRELNSYAWLSIRLFSSLNRCRVVPLYREADAQQPLESPARRSRVTHKDHHLKPGAKREDGGPKMGLRPGYGLRPVVTIIIMVELVV